MANQVHYALMRCYRDEYGQLQQRRIGTRAYKTLKVAARRADQNRGAYVTEYGKGEVVHLGTWAL